MVLIPTMSFKSVLDFAPGILDQYKVSALHLIKPFLKCGRIYCFWIITNISVCTPWCDVDQNIPSNIVVSGIHTTGGSYCNYL